MWPYTHARRNPLLFGKRQRGIFNLHVGCANAQGTSVLIRRDCVGSLRMKLVTGHSINKPVMLKHHPALLKSYGLCTAVIAVTGRCGVMLTILDHCLPLSFDSVTASVKNFHRMWKISEQNCKLSWSVLSFTLLSSPKPLFEMFLGLPGHHSSHCRENWQQCSWLKSHLHDAFEFLKTSHFLNKKIKLITDLRASIYQILLPI